jgi:hypothetical protein
MPVRESSGLFHRLQAYQHYRRSCYCLNIIDGITVKDAGLGEDRRQRTRQNEKLIPAITANLTISKGVNITPQ